ncbi:hypothetical protein [Desulforegula conservatrix]|uniref:hypothetical protein n=1 Tax=Desulforegula conservatrix TaxID=153026 RepID=UPI00040873C8|nr:hypothetical protein [Desulforegula conservatrix]
MKLFKIAEKERKKRINGIHENLNTVVMDLFALVRADDEETRHSLKIRAVTSLKNVKRGMAELGLEYQG